MMTENAIRDAFEHNDPAKYQDFFNCLHDAAKEKTTAELGHTDPPPADGSRRWRAALHQPHQGRIYR